MGPMALMDMLGLDVCHHIAAYLATQYGERMAEAALLRALYDAGRYGQKKGRGFYDYPGAVNSPKVDTLIREVHQRESIRAGSTFSANRLMVRLLNEAFYCVQEDVARAEDVDLACTIGLGMHVRKGDQLVACGPLGYADEMGLDALLDTLRGLQATLGERFRPAAILEQRVRARAEGRNPGHS